MKLTIDDVRSRFIEHFDGTTGSVYASPGRINLIGEHTDYNDGFVFPGAVQQGMIAEIKVKVTEVHLKNCNVNLFLHLYRKWKCLNY